MILFTTTKAPKGAFLLLYNMKVTLLSCNNHNILPMCALAQQGSPINYRDPDHICLYIYIIYIYIYLLQFICNISIDVNKVSLYR